MSNPSSSIGAKLYYASSIADLSDSTKRKQVQYLQSIPELVTPPDPITWTAIDIDEERQVPGKKKASDFEVEFIYTETQYDELRAIENAGTEKVWALQLTGESASTSGSPKTFYFTGKCAVYLSEISDEEMLKAKLRIYKSSNIQESEGFPTVSNGG